MFALSFSQKLYEAYKNFPAFLESADSLGKLSNFLQFSFYLSLFSYLDALLQSGTRFIMSVLEIFPYPLSQFMCKLKTNYNTGSRRKHISSKRNMFRRRNVTEISAT